MFRGNISEDILKLLHRKDKIFTYVLCLSGVPPLFWNPQDPFLEVEIFYLVLQGPLQPPPGFLAEVTMGM